MRLIYTAISIIIFLLFSNELKTQCTTGNEPECMCTTAQVLCSVTELNGYSNSMSDFQHPQDGPDDFCGGNTVSDNPTWFAFIACVKT